MRLIGKRVPKMKQLPDEVPEERKVEGTVLEIRKELCFSNEAPVHQVICRHIIANSPSDNLLQNYIFNGIVNTSVQLKR